MAFYLCKAFRLGPFRVNLSTRGPGGGFSLALDPSGLTLADVIQPFDDIAHESSCLLGLDRCSDTSPCAAHARWKSVSASVKAFLLDTTIQDMTGSDAEPVADPAGHTSPGRTS